MEDEASLQSLSGQLERGEIGNGTFLRRIARYMTDHVECSRAGVWLFGATPAGKMLKCVSLYDATTAQRVAVRDIGPGGVAPYFEALARDGCVMAADAQQHPVTRAFLDAYLEPFDVGAQLSVGLSVNGVLSGAFSCEQVGSPREWTQRDLQTLRQISSHAGLSLMRAAARIVDTAPGAMWSATQSSWLATLAMDVPPDDPVK